MKIFTIGFTKKTAEQFFGLLRRSGAKRLVDVRLNNVSQLAGFAKRDDLAFFLRELCQMDYVHLPILAPTKDILDEFKKNKGGWGVYERRFRELLQRRKVEDEVARDLMHGACLLCSEHEPKQCHRRLVAEYLRDCWGDVEITHLVS